MSHIHWFTGNKASGHLAIGDEKEIDKATWRKPRGIRLTPTSRYIRDKLSPSEAKHFRVRHLSDMLTGSEIVR